MALVKHGQRVTSSHLPLNRGSYVVRADVVNLTQVLVAQEHIGDNWEQSTLVPSIIGPETNKSARQDSQRLISAFGGYFSLFFGL